MQLDEGIGDHMSLLHSSIDELPDMTFIFDRSGRILEVNKAFRECVTSLPDGGDLPFSEAFQLIDDIRPRDIVEQCETESVRPVSAEAIVLLGDNSQQTVLLNCARASFGSGAEALVIATGRLMREAVNISGESSGERKFRRLAEAAPVAIYQADPQGNISYVNQQWAQKLGYSQDELLGTGWQRFVVDAQVYKDDPPWIGFSPENSSRIRTNRFRTSDGEVIEFQTLNQAEFSPDGKLLGFVGVMFDVTEQAKALRDYDRSEKRFSAFASLSSVGIFRADAKGNLFFANDKWCEIAGIGPTEAMGEGWVNAVHRDDRSKVIEAWRSVIELSEGQGRFRFVHSDGGIRHVEVVATAETAVGERIHGYIGIVVDVTRNEEMSEQLRQKEHQLAMLAANSRDPIFRLDLEGRCIYASPAAEEMLGAKTEGIVGASMIEKCHPDDLPIFIESFFSLASGTKERSEVTFRAQAPLSPHDYHWMDAQGAVIKDAQGHPSEVIVSLRDVTAQKKLESNLREAREAAERSASSKSSFLANMSHEIRTPMNGVLGYADLLAVSDLNDEQREHVELIRDSGKSMMHLLGDVLDFSKIEAGQLSITEQPVDLPHILNSTAKLVRPTAIQKELDLEVQVSDAVPRWIMSDRMRLRQILSNLLSNAVKFTDSGFVRLTAKEQDAELVITVEDSGCGISPHRTEIIFDSFAQESDITYQKFGGTGLGLAISRSLAEMMKGSLAVESERGKGSTFTLRVPLKIADAPAGDPVSDETDAHSFDFDGKVLVAEDHPVNQAMVSAMLRKIGVEFELVSDGAAAVSAVTKADRTGRPFKLVLMDIEMPVMNGVECAQELRAEGFGEQALPIVALTANAFSEDVTAYLQAGMQSHLAKPLRLDELVRELRHWA